MRRTGIIGEQMAVEIRVLAKHGKEVREIARELGVSRDTVRRYLREPEAERYSARPPQASKLDPHKRYIVERVSAAPAWSPGRRRRGDEVRCPGVGLAPPPGKKMVQIATGVDR